MTIISGLPDDTVQACCSADRDRNLTDAHNEAMRYIRAAYYVNGHGAPHYPVPTTRMDAALSRQNYWQRYFQNRQTQYQ